MTSTWTNEHTPSILELFNQQDSFSGLSLRHIIYQQGPKEIIEEVAKIEGDATVQSHSGNTCLHLLAENRKLDVVFLKNNRNVEPENTSCYGADKEISPNM